MGLGPWDMSGGLQARLPSRAAHRREPLCMNYSPCPRGLPILRPQCRAASCDRTRNPAPDLSSVLRRTTPSPRSAANGPNPCRGSRSPSSLYPPGSRMCQDETLALLLLRCGCLSGLGRDDRNFNRRSLRVARSAVRHAWAQTTARLRSDSSSSRKMKGSTSSHPNRGTWPPRRAPLQRPSTSCQARRPPCRRLTAATPPAACRLEPPPAPLRAHGGDGEYGFSYPTSGRCQPVLTEGDRAPRPVCATLLPWPLLSNEPGRPRPRSTSCLARWHAEGRSNHRR